jgi:hypothetical protein
MEPQEIERRSEIIQGKLNDGKLPYNSIPRIWGGPGQGEQPEVAISAPAFLMEGIAEGGGGVQFRVRCSWIT